MTYIRDFEIGENVEDFRELMSVCYELETGPLNGVPKAERDDIAIRFIDKTTTDVVSIDYTVTGAMSKDEQIVVCTVCYTLILHELRAFEALLLSVNRYLLLKVFCDPGERYLNELYEKVDILDGLVYSPGRVGRDAALNLADYVDDLDKTKRAIKVAKSCAVVTLIDIVIIFLCAWKLL